MGAPPILTAADVDGYRQTLSNWGRWGEGDELGCLNHLRPEHTARAASLVRSGRTVSCSRPLPTEPAVDNPSPALHHMTGTGTEGHGADWFGLAPHGYATSHLDALCHIMWDGMVYGGRPADVVTAHGAVELGVQTLREGIVARGVLLDVPAALGVDALEPGTPITVDDLEAAEARAGEGEGVGEGDVLLVRTGRWRWRDDHGPWAAWERLAGLHASCLPWLHERRIAMLGSDGVSDVHPSHIEGVRLPIHTVGIVAMGLHLLDNLDLEALAVACGEEGRAAFLLTIAPLVLEGGTASPVNPIATF
jgi:kynurenine formamidase